MASSGTPPHDYRIEKAHTKAGDGDSLLPDTEPGHLYADASLAVAVAVKSVTDPSCQEVRVVHVPSGEVVFRTPVADDGVAGPDA